MLRGLDLGRLVEHRESVQAADSLEQVYKAFRGHTFEFAAVVEGSRYSGMVSRGHVGFLLGARFGFAIYAKQPVSKHMLREALTVREDGDVMALLGLALARSGKSFFDDVALVGADGVYRGMIPVRRMIALQSEIISEQSTAAQRQQVELAEKHRQLFQSVNELRQSEGRYAALFRNTSLGIALLNTDGTVDVCNQRAESLIGLDPARNDGQRNVADRIAPARRAEFLGMLSGHEADVAIARSSEREFPVLTAKCGERLFRFFTTWIVETGHCCVQFHDVTEQRALERQAALHEKSALFESLVGGIAHELNNKLSPVLGFTELLAERLSRDPADADAVEYCNTIRKSATEAAKIIRQLLQLSRPPAKEAVPCDLRVIVAEATDMLRYRLRAKATTLDWTAGDEPVPIVGDPSQLKQVLLNLMINALDAMEQSPRRELRLRVASQESHAVVTVSDTGHGIPEAHLGTIFDPFFTTKAPDRGTGLGLCVCLSIVRQHQGEIAVRSTLDEGTTFSVRLPLSVANFGDAPPRGSATRRAPGATPAARANGLPRRRAMIVDDERFITAMVQESLRRELGWRVDRAHNGREAIRKLEEEVYDLLISDVRMPELDGLGLYQWILQHHPSLAARVLFVTGDAGSAELTKNLHALGRPVLYKPFTTAELVEHCLRIEAAEA
jgi:signal transduction histidine kinase/ActR/RegA family two-component response regulator